ncbi:MAG: IS21 family transposase [Nitrospiraceae bacterium]|nr:MAG: IS21 family transposase [Nitrospiraceae bacterium]
MLDKRIIFEIHKLKNMGLKQRQIARELRVGRDTVKKYLEDPEKTFCSKASRSSKLDPFKDNIAKYLDDDPQVKATVILQHLQQQGFDGEITILRNYLRKVRGKTKYREPFIRFESKPGEQMQIDWGHFGTLSYGEHKKKLYALAVIESYSRKLYVEFTHSQKQEALHQGLVNAFSYFMGSPQNILVDNMVTAVIERDRSLVRFNEVFLDFLRPFRINPVACNVRAPNEKGKIENAIKYLRQNFWPLRSFTDLNSVQTQVMEWLDTVANVRTHQTTGQRPDDRFKDISLRPLPELLPDYRETSQVTVYKDFAVRFDCNTYTVPPWAIGKKLTLKADNETVIIYHKQKAIATHHRSWEKRRRIELPAHVEQVRKMKKRLWQDRQVAAFLSLGQDAQDYLDALVKAGQPVKKNVAKLLCLRDEYGAPSLILAIQKALKYHAAGADYIENILYQEMTPQHSHPPVRLKDQDLNRIRLSEPLLTEYDAYIKRRKNND